MEHSGASATDPCGPVGWRPFRVARAGLCVYGWGVWRAATAVARCHPGARGGTAGYWSTARAPAPDTLSGGERQCVAIVRALEVSPRLLLMDEPLASLDAARKREILPFIETFQRELVIPVIYVTHDLEEVTRLADHLVLIDAGQIVAAGDLHELLTRLDLPLAHEAGASAVLEAEVAGHDTHYHLTYLDSAAGRFSVIDNELPPGQAVRLEIAARDVRLTLSPQAGTTTGYARYGLDQCFTV
ncbi:MAG: ATP-binding cassette domain-containing protein [Xanthomonadales bacterium]|nr:ATP-binding cassette domain-containing protein [Xanthomonadales bacterium]